MPMLPSSGGSFRQANHVQYQRGGSNRVATLPRKLERHGRTEEPLKMYVVPRGFPISQALNILDGDQRLRTITKNFAQQMVFAMYFRRFVGWIVQHDAIEITKNIMSDPAHYI